jgi:hypothetical protein
MKQRRNVRAFRNKQNKEKENGRKKENKEQTALSTMWCDELGTKAK